MKVKTGLRAAGASLNHSRSALKVKTALKAGKIATNHNRTPL